MTALRLAFPLPLAMFATNDDSGTSDCALVDRTVDAGALADGNGCSASGRLDAPP